MVAERRRRVRQALHGRKWARKLQGRHQGVLMLSQLGSAGVVRAVKVSQTVSGLIGANPRRGVVQRRRQRQDLRWDTDQGLSRDLRVRCHNKDLSMGFLSMGSVLRESDHKDSHPSTRNNRHARVLDSWTQIATDVPLYSGCKFR